MSNSVTLTIDELHFLLMQSAAFAIKQSRAGTYIGAGQVANRMINPDAEVLEHRASIGGMMATVITLSNKMNKN